MARGKSTKDEKFLLYIDGEMLGEFSSEKEIMDEVKDMHLESQCVEEGEAEYEIFKRVRHFEVETTRLIKDIS